MSRQFIRGHKQRQIIYLREVCFSSLDIVTQEHKHCSNSLTTTQQVELSKGRVEL